MSKRQGDNVALRAPAHRLAQPVLAQFGGGIAARSANRRNKPSPITAQGVRAELDEVVAAVLDRGACTMGIEFTIVALSTDRAGALRPLRPGAITVQQIEQGTGRVVEGSIKATPGAVRFATRPASSCAKR